MAQFNNYFVEINTNRKLLIFSPQAELCYKLDLESIKGIFKKQILSNFSNSFAFFSNKKMEIICMGNTIIYTNTRNRKVLRAFTEDKEQEYKKLIEGKTPSRLMEISRKLYDNNHFMSFIQVAFADQPFRSLYLLRCVHIVTGAPKKSFLIPLGQSDNKYFFSCFEIFENGKYFVLAGRVSSGRHRGIGNISVLKRKKSGLELIDSFKYSKMISEASRYFEKIEMVLGSKSYFLAMTKLNFLLLKLEEGKLALIREYSEILKSNYFSY